jgi:hypothetical protein
MFPTTDDVGEFSKSRFGPLITDNPLSIGKHVKPGGRGTDTTSLKKVGSGFLYLRGARLSHVIGDGQKESSKLRSIPADCVKFDESDLMDEQVFAKARGRLGDSAVGREVYLSNPTIPDFGIDKIFQLSDQRYFHRRCVCGLWSSPDETFPECVKVLADGTGFIACMKCGRDIGPKSGLPYEWIPKYRENSDYMAGWHMSQLMSTARTNDPAEILNAYNDPPDGNLADVYRLRLGLPYVAAEDKLSLDTVWACCGNDSMPTYHKGPCAMGIDVGKNKHVVIGIRTGKDRYEILKTVRLKEWSEIHDIATRFNVRSAVVDIRPYEDSARQFQSAEPYQVFLCEYKESALPDVATDDVTKTHKAYRTGLCDVSHRVIADRQIKLPRRSTELDLFARQCCNMAKVLETDKRTGVQIYRYRSTGSGGDHYRHALNYFLLAAKASRIASAKSARQRGKKAKTHYNRFSS